MDPKLEWFLVRVSKRFQLLRFGWLLAATWSLAFVAFAATLALKPTWFALTDRIAWVTLAFVIVSTLVAWLVSRSGFRDRHWLATQIERRHPGLNQRLLTAVSSRREDTSRFLRKTLTDETLMHAYLNDWNDVVSKRSIYFAWFTQCVALFSMMAIVISATTLGSSRNHGSLLNMLAPDGKIELDVQPGNAEIERGTNCLVTVRFHGAVPDQVALVATTPEVASNQPTLVVMERSLNDPVFAGYLNKVMRDTEYKIEFEGGQSDLFQLKVFDYPTMLRSDVEITPPIYTGQEKRLVKDTRRVTIPEGTTLTWICKVNKPLESAKLVDDEGTITELVPESSTSTSAEEGLAYRATIELNASRKWKVQLMDNDGRSARIEETLIATVLPNKPPEVKVEKVTDASVSPLEELSIQAKVRDDYHLVRAGVQFSLSGGESIEKTLFERSVAQENEPKIEAPEGKTIAKISRDVAIQQLLDFEALGSQPDQFLSYYFWAEDIDQTGEVRRVDGEIYFADVRPFEEIFREGESPEGEQSAQQQQSPQAKQADEIAELQKKIMSGTWNIIRSQKSAELTQKSADDVEVLSDSQNEAIALAAKLEEKIRDEQSKKHLEFAVSSMESALEKLDETVLEKKVQTLRSALQFEQAAYEGLLRLRAREHSIVQSKSKSSGSGSSSAKNRQKQIDQLELKDDSERYEKEREATPESEQADREMRQIMSRLDEVARRQEDINRQLKDLETAIQAAKNEDEKKELEEQLKRLRENQEELLRDTDELMNRMQESEQSSESSSEKSNQQRESMQEAQQQVSEAREEIRQAAESLSQTKPSASQALSSGTRAEKKISETRDQLRQQSAQRFEETMKNMLSRARELEKDQQELSSATLGKENENNDRDVKDDSDEQGGLRSTKDGQPQESPSREEAWKEQREKLNELLQEMQDTVTEAEPSEPLLAEKLYETFRETKQRDIETRLDLVPRLVDRGFAEPVQQTLDEIETGMRELREGVELAAESVLGSEVEGLRRALNELETLEKQLQEEISNRSPSNSNNRDLANNASNPSESSDNPSSNAASENGEKQSDAQSDSQKSDSEKQTEVTSEKSGKQESGKSGKGKQEGKGNSSDSKQGSASSPNESGKQTAANSTSKAPSSASSKSGSKNGAPANEVSSSEQQQGGGSFGGRSLADIMERRADPITGNNFGEWSDALRDVEESVRDPEMRGTASQIRQAARELHRDFVRHAKEPQWDLVRELVAKPLAQLRETVQAELLRKSADRNAVVPIDRDPVPTVFEQRLRRYYENLGSQKAKR